MNAIATLTSRRPAPGHALVRVAAMAPRAVVRLLPCLAADLCAHDHDEDRWPPGGGRAA